MPDPLSILLSPQSLISSEDNTLYSPSNYSKDKQGTGESSCLCANCEMDRNAPQPIRSFAQDKFKPRNGIPNQDSRLEGELRRVPAQIILNRQPCQQSENYRESYESCDQLSVKSGGNYQLFNQYAKNAGTFQSYQQPSEKNSVSIQSFDEQSVKNRGELQPFNQQSEKRGNYQPFNHQNTKNRGSCQSFDEQSAKNRGDYQVFDQHSEKNRGNYQPFNQQNTKNRGRFQSFDEQSAKNRGDYQVFDQHSENKRENYQPLNWSDKNRGSYSCKSEDNRESEEQRNHANQGPQRLQCEGQCCNADLVRQQTGAGRHEVSSQGSLKRKYPVSRRGKRKLVSPAYGQQKQFCGQKTILLGATDSLNSVELGKNYNSCGTGDYRSDCETIPSSCDSSYTVDRSQVIRPYVQINETNVSSVMNAEENSQLKCSECKFDGANTQINTIGRFFTNESENEDQTPQTSIEENENKWPSVYNNEVENYFPEHNMTRDKYSSSWNRRKAHERNDSSTSFYSGLSRQHNIHKSQKRLLGRTECSCTSLARHSKKRARNLHKGKCGKMLKNTNESTVSHDVSINQ